MTFLSDSVMSGHDWRAMELSVQRVLAHCDWTEVIDVSGPGDGGADILAVRRDAKTGRMKSYVVQVKAVSGAGYVGRAAVQEVLAAQSIYKSDIAVIATNGDFRKSVWDRQSELKKHGFDLRLWNGAFLRKLLEAYPESHAGEKSLREYQQDVYSATVNAIESGRKRVLFHLATGLGKTVVAATITRSLMSSGIRSVLVLCHSVTLSLQLQRDFWSQLPKSVPTYSYVGGATPVPQPGVTFSLYQTVFSNLGGLEAGSFDMVIVDEAHHALAGGFASTLSHLSPGVLIGMTATPWRGDGGAIREMFGEPLASVSLVQGMGMGFLSRIDYRLMCDNVDWEWVQENSQNRYTVKDLNKRLFLPQRDESVVAIITKTAESVADPRIIVFAPSIKYSERIAKMLTVSGLPCKSVSGIEGRERYKVLSAFASGKLNAIAAVDVLNEGVDVPETNILVFLRATHSRRIFVQQLGRGLRVSPGKTQVVVLDFVSDIRRVAAISQLSGDLTPVAGDDEVLPTGSVTFADRAMEDLISGWIEAVADLDDVSEDHRLILPEVDS